MKGKYNVKLYDHHVWPSLEPEDLWVYDKLILSRKLNYVCGPAGVGVPQAGTYIVRPITNISGMGIEARFEHIQKDTDHLHPGLFWCEIFQGRHFSVDYVNGVQTTIVEGIREESDPLYKWREWRTVDDHQIQCPKMLEDLFNRHNTINCEFIGDRLIEVHLRGNPDFRHQHERLMVVWEDDNPTPPAGWKFISDPDYKRQGFFVEA